MRTDPHRPGAILPTDYAWVASFGEMKIAGEEPETYGYEDVPEGPFADIHEGLHSCDVCGARYNHGCVLLHNPTGIHITIGHDCASKYSLTLDLAGWKAWHAAARDKRAQAAIEMKYATAAREWKAANPAATAALDLGLGAHVNEYRCEAHGAEIFNYSAEPTDDFCSGCQKALRSRDRDRKNSAIVILSDMARKLARYGTLSEKQAAFAVKLGETVSMWTPAAEEATVPAPEGRVTFTGTVVSVKEREGYMGGVEWKATVKVTTPEGVWLAWMTANDSAVVKGATITVTATLTRSDRDAHFAFGKRPVVLTEEEADALTAKEAKRAAREAKKTARALVTA